MFESATSRPSPPSRVMTPQTTSSLIQISHLCCTNLNASWLTLLGYAIHSMSPHKTLFQHQNSKCSFSVFPQWPSYYVTSYQSQKSRRLPYFFTSLILYHLPSLANSASLTLIKSVYFFSSPLPMTYFWPSLV